MINKSKYFLIIIFLFTLLPTIAGESKILRSYIKQGIKNNLALQQKNIELEKSIEILREAKSMFLPSISIEARYSKAGGGRTIDMPIGDLINPVHQTLNQLLLAQSQTPYFPGNVENQSIPFLRKTEQETKLRIIQPVFVASLYYNKKIKKEFVDLKTISVDIYKEELKFEIKRAYFIYLKTLKVKELLLETELLLNNNITFSESLFRNGKVTEEVLLRSRAELSSLKKELYSAEKNIILSASYFNFLLNQPMDKNILIDNIISTPTYSEKKIEDLIYAAYKKRGEIKKFKHAISIKEQSIKIHRSSILPTITAVFDYGIQGENYRISKDSDYWIGSLVFSWNIFNGGKDSSRRKQALLDKMILQKREEEVKKQISLEVKKAYYNYFETKKTFEADIDLLETRKKGYDIVSKKYKQGMIPQIEFIQSRKNYTDAKIKHTMTLYDLHISKSELEKIVSLKGDK